MHSEMPKNYGSLALLSLSSNSSNVVDLFVRELIIADVMSGIRNKDIWQGLLVLNSFCTQANVSGRITGLNTGN